MNCNNKIADFIQVGNTFAVCTIVRTKGSTPRKSGAKMIVMPNGNIVGSIGGGNLEKKVIEDALTCIKKNKSEYFQHDLLHRHAMCCGGTVEIFIEFFMPEKKLFIFGAGHTGAALANFAVTVGFDVFLIDDRKEQFGSDLHSDIHKMPMEFNLALQAIQFGPNTYIAIMTYEHETDREILGYCVGKEYAYLGMIGSQRKVEITKKMFTDAGLADASMLEKVDMPMGININAQDPHEIAISILAKLITIKNKNLHE